VSTGSSIIIIVLMLIMVSLAIPIGFYVYRDANRRGMHAPLWVVIAVLAPGFIGLIIYLIVRGNFADFNCPNCGYPVSIEYIVCPKFGTRLKSACPSCGLPAEADWTVCPKCATPLPSRSQGQSGFIAPVRTRDSALGKIILLIVLVPLLLLIFLIAFSFLNLGVTQHRVELAPSISIEAQPSTEPYYEEKYHEAPIEE
jgi:predicted RNA-binding Zn-ribbon protein involved in translation (DUF1610 family)